VEAALGERRGKAPRRPSSPRPRRKSASGMEAEWPRRRPTGGSGRSPRARPRRGDARLLTRFPELEIWLIKGYISDSIKC
jgi:hypothetical protein